MVKPDEVTYGTTPSPFKLGLHAIVRFDGAMVCDGFPTKRQADRIAAAMNVSHALRLSVSIAPIYCGAMQR